MAGIGDPTCTTLYEHYGSPWPLLATEIMADQLVPVGIINWSVGASSLSYWVDGGQFYTLLVNTVTAAGTGGCEAMVLYEGEANSGNKTCAGGTDAGLTCTIDADCPSSTCVPPTLSYIETAIQSTATAAYRDLGSVLFPIQVGGSSIGGVPYIDTVRLGIQTLWSTGTHVAGGITMYDQTPYGLHYMTTASLQTIANRTFAAIQAALWGGPDGAGPVPSSVQMLGDRRSIVVTYTDNTLPITSSGSLATVAWTINDNGTTHPSSTVTISASNQITIVAPSPLTGIGTTLTYASDNTAMGAVVPTDSSTFNLPAQITIAQAVTPTLIPCVGDCNGNGHVTVDEILTMVNIALGNANISACTAGDANKNGQITVDEILTAVNNALNGCQLV
ncbi:MAG TPA: sialate O-acetylesterase [Candidatus Binatia bacterium]